MPEDTDFPVILVDILKVSFISNVLLPEVSIVLLFTEPELFIELVLFDVGEIVGSLLLSAAIVSA